MIDLSAFELEPFTDFVPDYGSEARAIVQWGLSDVLVYIGELAPDKKACACLGREGMYSPAAHYESDHNSDCGTAPPCGGCYRCLAQQYAYYESLEPEPRPW
jgi:hypothetical protein